MERQNLLHYIYIYLVECEATWYPHGTYILASGLTVVITNRQFGAVYVTPDMEGDHKHACTLHYTAQTQQQCKTLRLYQSLCT
jgi:hypothetical protein